MEFLPAFRYRGNDLGLIAGLADVLGHVFPVWLKFKGGKGVATYIGVLIPMLVAAFEDPLNMLWIAIFATVYQQFENYILSPRISRRTMQIHPAVAFASVIVFANLLGAMGALIAIPLAAAIVAIVDTYGHRYELIPELEL